MTALPSPSLLADSRVLAGRHLVLIARRPASIIAVVGTPMLFAVLFFTVFDDVMERYGVDYAQHLLPGVLVQAMFFNGMSSAVAAAEDSGTGMLRRLRTAPVARLSPLFGWLGARVILALASAVALVAVGYLLGFRLDGGPARTVGFAGVVGLLAATMCAGFVVLGMSVPNLPLLEALTNLIFFPLVLVSTVFTPLEAFPDWLRPVVEHQPVSRVADGLRAFSLADSTGAGTVLAAGAWLVGLLVLFIYLGDRHLGRTTS